MITAILLAAGASRRFGAPKLLQDLNGKPVVRWSADALLGAPVDEIVVVVPPAHEEIRRALTAGGTNARFVVNPNPDGGMGASLACGVGALRSETKAVLVALADEPVPDRAALDRVVQRYRAGGASIVVPMYRGVRGHPVLFDRSVFAELAALTGDRGARDVTDRDPGRVAIIELDAPKPIDVDTPGDLASVRDRVDQGRTLLDRLMPEYHERASYRGHVRASADVTYRAMMETNLADSLLTRLLMRARFLGRETFGSFRFADLPSRGTFFKIAEDPPREMVAGIVGRFWSIHGNVQAGDCETFYAPLARGMAKAAWNFRVEPAAGGSWLSTETRILCADEESRLRFHRYWTIVGPFSGLIRLEALRLIRRNAHFMASSNSAPT